MATLKLIENGIKSVSNGRKKRRKRRNPVTPVKAVKRKSNGVRKLSAVANPKRRRRTTRRRRNGISAVTRRRSNGLFGDTSAMVKKTLTLTGGAVVTNVGGNYIASFLSPYLASFGLGAYSNLIIQFLVAMFGVPELAKVIKQDKDMARLGGMLSVTLTALNQFFPQFAGLNPFSNSAIVVNPNGQVALTGEAVKQVAAAAAQDTAAKISGFANQMQAMNSGSGWQDTNYIAGSNF